MGKIKSKNSGMCCQHRAKTQTDTLTVLDTALISFANLAAAITGAGFDVMKKTGTLSLSLIGGILIMLLSIAGCSDVPYTGPMLTVDHVDRYLGAIGEDTVCLQDGFDSVCIRLLPREEGGEYVETGGDDAPIVHVHPTSIVYEFYYEDSLILSAEQAVDTTQIVQDLIDAGRLQLPPDAENLGTGGDQGNDGDASGEWIIKIYHPDAFPRVNRRLTLENSGLDIRVVEGPKILPFRRRDLEINDFAHVKSMCDCS